MNGRDLAIASATLGLAALAFLAAAGNARGSAGMISSFSPLPTQGLALARSSSQVLAVAEAATSKGQSISNMQPMLAEAERAARQAYLREPLSIEAIRNFALLRGKRGNTRNQFALMRQASEFSRRDAGTDLWLANFYGQRGEFRAMLQWLDYALRTSSATSELIVPTLLNAAQDRRIVEPLTELLARDPPWAEELWNGLDAVPVSHLNMAQVRTRLHRKGARLDPRHDESLMLLLTREGRFAEATALAAAVPKMVHAGTEGGSEFVIDSGFEGLAALPPFGWQIIPGSETDVYIDDDSGTLHVGVFGNAKGTIARQLVRLPRVPVRLVVTFLDSSRPAEGRVFTTIECAQSGLPTPPHSMELNSVQSSTVMTAGMSGCEYYWLNINVRAPVDRSSYEAEIDSISLRLVNSA